MLSLVIYLLVYLVGGLTLLPGILFCCWYFYIERSSPLHPAMDYPPLNKDTTTTNDTYDNKRGWIRLMGTKDISIESGIENGPSGKKPNFFFFFFSAAPPPPPPSSSSSSKPRFSCTLYYAILRGGTLYCFDNEKQQTCQLMLPIHNYTVSLFPTTGKAEAELFGRHMSICLTPNTNNDDGDDNGYYITCQRPIDKEDWYFALTSASHYLADNNHHGSTMTMPDNNSNGHDATLFDPWAMSGLRGLLDGTVAQIDAQCWNAMLGRLFLGVYKTETWRQFWTAKMKNKLDKINHYHQHPLQSLAAAAAAAAGDPSNDATAGGVGGGGGYGKHASSGKRSLMRLLPLQLQRISMGDAIPCLTNAKLLEFTTDGTCVVQAQLDYNGDFLVVLRTGLHTLWRPPSSLWSPFEKKNKQKTNNNNNNNNNTNDASGGSGGPSSLPLVLSLQLRHCSGKVIFKIKPPPTCRIWAAFETMPTMEWQVTPVVLDKQIKWSYVTHLLQTKIKELIAESLVMPNMEDFPFYDSGGLGGIFGGAGAGAGDKEGGHGDILADQEKNKPPASASPVAEDTKRPLNDKDSAIDVDISSTDDDDKQQQQQQPPMVSTLVQGYMDRIRNPHKYPPTLSSLDNVDTTSLKLDGQP